MAHPVAHQQLRAAPAHAQKLAAAQCGCRAAYGSRVGATCCFPGSKGAAAAVQQCTSSKRVPGGGCSIGSSQQASRASAAATLHTPSEPASCCSRALTAAVCCGACPLFHRSSCGQQDGAHSAGVETSGRAAGRGNGCDCTHEAWHRASCAPPPRAAAHLQRAQQGAVGRQPGQEGAGAVPPRLGGEVGVELHLGPHHGIGPRQQRAEGAAHQRQHARAAGGGRAAA